LACTIGRAPVALEGRSRAKAALWPRQTWANPDASVVICEGEKAADAAARMFPKSVCMTSPGGSQAASKADWKPLAGRRVLIWPDCDEPGAKYGRKVARIIHGLGCEVSIIDAVALAGMAPGGGTREPVKGFDAADAVPSGRTSRRFARRLTGSPSHTRPRQPTLARGLMVLCRYFRRSPRPSPIRPMPLVKHYQARRTRLRVRRKSRLPWRRNRFSP
jgi:hypothetical protein